jgi:predicted nucleic acid-binding protein
MLVADTSALISLATGRVLDTALTEFDVHTTETVVEELEATAAYEDRHGDAARTVLSERDRITVHAVTDRAFQSSRIDRGEGSCVRLAEELEADFLLTDDYRALPELQTLTDCRVAVSPILLGALVKRDVLSLDDAWNRLELMAEHRDWLETPIYRHARNLFDSE